MDRQNFAFGKRNYIICIISVVLIILGFILMSGPGTSVAHGFEPDIFSRRRIVVGPMISFFGFLLMILAIFYPDNKGKIAK